MQKVADKFSTEDAQQIKKIEAITNHDVKAVEYYLKEQLEKPVAMQSKNGYILV